MSGIPDKLNMSLDDLATGNSLATASEVLSKLSKRLNVKSYEISFLSVLPIDLLETILQTFDPSGTKDGLLLCRLESYARGVVRKSGVKLPQALVRPIHSNQGGGASDDFPGLKRKVEEYVRGLELGDEAGRGLELILRMAEDIQVEILEKFDQSNSRNAWFRLLAYIRSIWLRRLGVNMEVSNFIREQNQDAQVEMMMKFDPLGTRDGDVNMRLGRFAEGVARRHEPGHQGEGDFQNLQRGAGGNPAVDRFVRKWSLHDDGAVLLEALPQEVQREVIEGFDGSNTRDGNVSRRLLGYVRQKWCDFFELDQECVDKIKRMPADGQAMVFAEFDPSETRDGNISGRLEGFLRKVRRMLEEEPDSGSWDTEVLSVADQAILNDIHDFVHDWGLDSSVVGYLESIEDPQVLDIVLEDFTLQGANPRDAEAALKAMVRQLSVRSRRGAPLRDGDSGYTRGKGGRQNDGERGAGGKGGRQREEERAAGGKGGRQRDEERGAGGKGGRQREEERAAGGKGGRQREDDRAAGGKGGRQREEERGAGPGGQRGRERGRGHDEHDRERGDRDRSRSARYSNEEVRYSSRGDGDHGRWEDKGSSWNRDKTWY